MRGGRDFGSGHLDAVSSGEDSLTVSWSVDGVPRAQHTYSITVDHSPLFDCLPLAEDVICLLQAAQGAHSNAVAAFSVNASGMTEIDSFNSYGVFLLDPLDEHQLLLWSWTSSEVLGAPEPYAQAWQTWVITPTSLQLTGCGPSRTDGEASGPVPEEPLTGPCPDGTGPTG
ncbi:hypothetical protein D1871_18155 [Nakamurella silvestris]|nr:hypothetical protein D1871_18155 [Nakamurella silvestris]